MFLLHCRSTATWNTGENTENIKWLLNKTPLKVPKTPMYLKKHVQVLDHTYIGIYSQSFVRIDKIEWFNYGESRHSHNSLIIIMLYIATSSGILVE